MSLRLTLAIFIALGAMQLLAWALARGLRVRLEARVVALGLAIPVAFLSPWLVGNGLLAPTGVLSGVLPIAPEVHHVRATHLILSDTLYQFLPWELEVRHALKSWRLPLWSDRLDGGSSPWLNPAAGVLSPIAMLARLAPIQHFLAVELLLKMLLAFEGTWLLVRGFGRSRVGAFLAAAGFCLAGGLMSWALFPQSSTVAWAPWLTLGCIHLFRRPTPLAMITTACIAAGMLLSGHPETALAAGLFAAVCGLGLRRRKTGLGKGLAAAGLAAVLGFGLASPQLLPFLYAVPNSQRTRDKLASRVPAGEPRPGTSASWFVPETAAFLRAPVNPRVFGLPYAEPARSGFDWADALSGYAGLVAFAGALVALLAVRDRRGWPCLGFALLALLVVAGFLPFARVIEAVPALRIPAYPRLLPVACLALAVAAAAGCDFMLYRAGRRLQVAVALAVAAAISLAADHSGPVILLWALLAGAAAVAHWRPSWGALALVATLGLDLVPWSQRLLPHGQAELFYPASELTARLARETGGGAWRVVGMYRLVYPSLLPVYGLAELLPNNVLTPSDFLRVLRAAFEFNPTDSSYYSDFAHADHPLLAFLNVRAVVSNLYLPPPRTLVPIADAKILPFLLYRNPAALPRWFVPSAVEVIDPPALERWIAALSEPGRVALFRGEIAGGPPPGAPGGVRAARLLAAVPGRVELEVPGAGSRRLLATSLTLPAGWRAQARGRTLAKLTVDGAFLGVDVPAWASRVELDFMPPGMRSGSILCALAVCGLLILAWRARRPPARWMAVAVLAAVAVGCGREPGAVKPLIDARHRAVMLVESGTLAPLASGPAGPAAANRFGAGWEARQIHGETALVPAARVARLEVVNLGAGTPRILTLTGVDMEPARGQWLRVRAADRELARLAVRLPLALRLPDDLPLGRVELELRLDLRQGLDQGGDEGSGGGGRAGARSGSEGGSGTGAGWGIGITSAAIAPSLPAGRARIEGGDVIQAGNVLVDVTHELAGGEVLVGTFVPPAAPRPGQRFELTAERPDGTPIRRFFWSPSFWDRFRSTRKIELPLRDARDHVRVRLVSRGASGDPPARWRGLGLKPANGQELPPGL